MSSPADTKLADRARQPGQGVTLVQGAVLAGAAATAVFTASWDRWRVGELLAIALLAVVSDLTSVRNGVGKMRVSGTLLGLMLAAVLLGGGPAALLGVVAISTGWLRRREPGHSFRLNLAVYAWFPLASGVFFHATTHLLHVGPNDVGYYFLVLPAFAVALIINVVGITTYEAYLTRSSPVKMVFAAFLPVLAAELASAVLLTAAVFFVVKTGTIGISLLAVVLAIFQYLVGELLKSKQRAEELRRKATTDELTGLANRDRFRTVLEERVAAAHASGGCFGVLLIDLDRFKEINDTLGHHYGDVLLRDLGPRLAESVGPNGLVARLGGDEFGVLPPQRTDDPDALGRYAIELLACVQRPMVVDELTLEVGASVGIARFPHDGADGHDLLRRADVAMYAAKEHHGSYELYEQRLDRHSVRRLTVLSDFRRALASDELVLHYQPIVDLSGGGRVRGAEALVRWQHPELGLLSPAEFVPIAEQSGLIGPLTRHVLERAISQCTTWRNQGRQLAVAVNLSVRDLLDRDLPRHVERLLDAYGLPADALHLEITESMIMSDPDRALATVTRLKDLGVCISVDDFGTGYSSLSNIRRLPISELKIDRMFISSLLQDENDLIIVRSTIHLGHDLGLQVVAEGVEDEMTLKRLAMLDCDLAQGYYLGRPLPSEEFPELIDSLAGSPARAASA